MKYIKEYKDYKDIDPFGEENWDELDSEGDFSIGKIEGDKGKKYFAIYNDYKENKIYLYSVGKVFINGSSYKFFELDRGMLTTLNEKDKEEILNGADIYIYNADNNEMKELKLDKLSNLIGTNINLY